MSVQENNDGSHISTPTVSEPKSPHSSDYTIYPKFDPNNVTRPPPAPISGDAAGVNPYVSPFSVPKSELFFILITGSLEMEMIERFEHMSFKEWVTYL